MPRLNSIHQKLAVPTEVLESGLVELEPVPGGRFEGEVDEKVADYLVAIAREPTEFIVAPAEKEKKEVEEAAEGERHHLERHESSRKR